MRRAASSCAWNVPSRLVVYPCGSLQSRERRARMSAAIAAMSRAVAVAVDDDAALRALALNLVWSVGLLDFGHHAKRNVTGRRRDQQVAQAGRSSGPGRTAASPRRSAGCRRRSATPCGRSTAPPAPASPRPASGRTGRRARSRPRSRSCGISTCFSTWRSTRPGHCRQLLARGLGEADAAYRGPRRRSSGRSGRARPTACGRAGG